MHWIHVFGAAIPKDHVGSVWTVAACLNGGGTETFSEYNKIPTLGTYLLLLSEERNICVPKDRTQLLKWMG